VQGSSSGSPSGTVGTSAQVFPPDHRGSCRPWSRAASRSSGPSRRPAQREQLRAKLDLLDTHLRERRFVLGRAPSLADFSLFHPCGPQDSAADDAILEPYAPARLMERIEAFGHGQITEIDGKEAVEVRAGDTRPRRGRTPGSRTASRPATAWRSSTRASPRPGGGELTTLRCRRSRSGVATSAPEVVVHFPREHYVVRRV